jgi:NAD+ diphosphatase
MIGMHIEATNTNLDINRDELEDARWFTRDEIRSAHIWSGNPIQSSGRPISGRNFDTWTIRHRAPPHSALAF